MRGDPGVAGRLCSHSASLTACPALADVCSGEIGLAQDEKRMPQRIRLNRVLPAGMRKVTPSCVKISMSSRSGRRISATRSGKRRIRRMD